MNATRQNKSRKAKAQTPEPPSEIVIERSNDYWCVRVGSHCMPISNEQGKYIYSHYDPMIVAKALKARANGPINVVVNL